MTARASVDLNSNTLTIDGKTTRRLRPKTAELIYALIHASPGTLTHAALHRALWGRRGGGEGNVSMQVSSARFILNMMGADIASIRGEGYRLVLPPEPST